MSSNDKNKLISLSEVKGILKKLEKDREELTYEQRIALEHSQKFAKLNVAKTKNMIKELNNLEFLEENHAYMIADLIPKTIDDVKTIFAKERMKLDDNKIKTILDIVNKYIIE